jgi:hypothetical protein
MKMPSVKMIAICSTWFSAGIYVGIFICSYSDKNAESKYTRLKDLKNLSETKIINVTSFSVNGEMTTSKADSIEAYIVPKKLIDKIMP